MKIEKVQIEHKIKMLKLILKMIDYYIGIENVDGIYSMKLSEINSVFYDQWYSKIQITEFFINLIIQPTSTCIALA